MTLQEFSAPSLDVFAEIYFNPQFRKVLLFQQCCKLILGPESPSGLTYGSDTLIFGKSCLLKTHLPVWVFLLELTEENLVHSLMVLLAGQSVV